MALTTRAALLGLLLAGTTSLSPAFAQTAEPTQADAPTPPAAATPAADPATTPVPTGAAPTPEATPTPDVTTAPTPSPATVDAPAAPTPGDATPTPSPSPAVTPSADASATPAADATPTPDASATPAATPAADATPAATPAADAAAATPAPGTPPAPAASRDAAQVGGYYIDSSHGDWTLRCLKAAEGTDPCELYQLLRDAQNNPVSEISIIPLAGEAVAGATMIAPLETDLVPGLGLRVDSGKQMAYPFSFCAPIGCVARVGFSQAEVDAMKRGSKATISLLPYGAAAEQRVDLNLSLKGFTAGFDAVKAKMPAQ